MFAPYFSSDDCSVFSEPFSGDAQGVYDKMLELHRALHRRLRDHSWDLHPHWNRSDIITPHSLALGTQFNGLAMPFTRSREQAVLVERLMGRDSVGPLGQVDIHRHPVIEIRLSENHFVVELIVSGTSWLDQQNLIGKMEVARHRQALRSLIYALPSDTVLGFWTGVELENMHLTVAQLSRGTVLDQWLSTFQDVHDTLRIGAWYHPQDAALNANSILGDVMRRIGSLYNLYTFLLWTSNNDFRSFYGRVGTGPTNRDLRLS